MASWITHLIVADKVMAQFPMLDRRGFCVGNIAPDCNIENKDWTAFTPPREVTHWMSGKRKVLSDCDDFYFEYIYKRSSEIKTNEQYSFLLGYYAHLLTDAAFQKFIRDAQRVQAVWERLKRDEHLKNLAFGYSEDWDSVKKIFTKQERMHEIYSMEAEYLADHPGSGYLTEILPLADFPDYIDYLPHGCIVRKIKVMGYLPKVDPNLTTPIAMSRLEFDSFADSTASLVMEKFKELALV